MRPVRAIVAAAVAARQWIRLHLVWPGRVMPTPATPPALPKFRPHVPYADAELSKVGNNAVDDEENQKSELSNNSELSTELVSDVEEINISDDTSVVEVRGKTPLVEDDARATTERMECIDCSIVNVPKMRESPNHCMDALGRGDVVHVIEDLQAGSSMEVLSRPDDAHVMKHKKLLEQSSINVPDEGSTIMEQYYNADRSNASFVDDISTLSDSSSLEVVNTSYSDMCSQEPAHPSSMDVRTTDSSCDEQDYNVVIRLIESKSHGVTLSNQLKNFRGRPTRETVAGVLQGLQNGDLALEFFGWAEEKGFDHDATTTNSLLFTLVRLGMSRKAYELFQQGSFHVDSFSVSTIVYGLTLSGELEAACNLMDKLKNMAAPYTRVLSSLVAALCNVGNVDRALRLVRDHNSDPRAYSSTYSTLIKALCRQRRNKVAWMLFYEILERGGNLDVGAYGTLMHGLCRSGNISRACSLLEDMTARGCLPNVIIFTTLIDGFCKANKVEQALEVLKMMKARELTPDVITFSALIDGICKTGDMHGAIELLKVMVEAGCKPNVVTYSSIVDGFCKCKRMHDAVEWMEAMVSDGCDPDVVTYTSIIHGYCLAKNVDEATRVFKQMVSAGVVPNRATYSSLVTGCLKAGEASKAHVYLREMIERGSTCNLAVYIDLIYGLCEGNCGVLLQYENKPEDCCVGASRVTPLFLMLKSMVQDGVFVVEEQMYSVREPRRGRAEQILEFMHRRGCLDDETLIVLHEGLANAAAVRDQHLEKENEGFFDI